MQELAAELAPDGVGRIELLRRGSNVVLQAPESRCILRLQHAHLADAVKANLDLVARLTATGAPLVGPLTSRVAMTDVVVLTAWPAGQPANAEDTAALGAVLQTLHDVQPPRELSLVNVTDRFDRRFADLPSDIPNRIAKALRDHADLAVDTLRAASSSSDVLLHGDAHVGNLVFLHDEPRLIDLDDLCRGPREFDLAPSLASYQRFHRDDRRWQAFRAAYGESADWDLVNTLTVVREATMNTWLAGLWEHDPHARDELIHRVDTWDKDWNSHEPWRAM
ncbi:Ser/Thr protein kinase RdoA (MazF antagonist) [Nocardioides albertanoniae]|uniref:Ser/Thr protein kinase RdoA (MazF antagonist) n=1 Tax=Nocardioides albertanoniae TaxID=1175486 RepID=A0A543A969_9ACTN|nr:Ser/Thr protein kinase RdoA (MazF antagonist) [Nocardioides albertanoniae]